MPKLANLDDEATLKQFGYSASSLKPTSSKRIIYICSHWYEPFEARRNVIQSSNHQCLSCYITNQKVGKTVIAQDILRVIKELGHQPTVAEYNQLGKYHYTTAKSNFDKDWADILEEIGLVYQRKPYTIYEVEKEINRVKATLGKIPNAGEYQKISTISLHIVKKTLVCDSWLGVIMKVFQLDIETAKSHLTYGNHTYQSTKHRLQQLKELANRLGHSPSCKQAEEAGIETTALYQRLKTNSRCK